MDLPPSTGSAVDGVQLLSRESVVPLYYQLQEVLKQEIESGRWTAGTRLPSEHELARRFGVSRIVVRQALEILKKDRQIVTVQGSGSFVAPPKVEHEVGSLSRLLAGPLEPGSSVVILDHRMTTVEPAIETRLGVPRLEPVSYVTWLWSLNDTPLGIGHSYFPRNDHPWFTSVTDPPDMPYEAAGRRWPIELGPIEASIEATQTGNFSSEQLGVQLGAPLFLISATERIVGADGTLQPFEFARVGYRADILAFRMAAASADDPSLAVTMSMH